MATYKTSDLVGQSPSREVTSPTGNELIECSVPDGSSPAGYTTGYIKQSNIGGGGGSSTTATPETKTGDYTFVLGDAGKVIYCDLTGVSPLVDVEFTIPTNASVAYPTGTLINAGFRGNGGASPANTLTIKGDTGVTVNGVSGGSVVLTTSHTGVAIHNIGTDEWVIW